VLQAMIDHLLGDEMIINRWMDFYDLENCVDESV
jgi:hypothetical protein